MTTVWLRRRITTHLTMIVQLVGCLVALPLITAVAGTSSWPGSYDAALHTGPGACGLVIGIAGGGWALLTQYGTVYRLRGSVLRAWGLGAGRASLHLATHAVLIRRWRERSAAESLLLEVQAEDGYLRIRLGDNTNPCYLTASSLRLLADGLDRPGTSQAAGLLRVLAERPARQSWPPRTSAGGRGPLIGT